LPSGKLSAAYNEQNEESDKAAAKISVAPGRKRHRRNFVSKCMAIKWSKV
jgi:hypothetical protein